MRDLGLSLSDIRAMPFGELVAWFGIALKMI